MSPLDRLNALDAAFLDLDTPRAPLHVGWTMRFEGTPPTLADSSAKWPTPLPVFSEPVAVTGTRPIR